MYVYHFIFASLQMSYVNVVDINIMHPILRLFVSNIHSTKFESDHRHPCLKQQQYFWILVLVESRLKVSLKILEMSDLQIHEI